MFYKPWGPILENGGLCKEWTTQFLQVALSVRTLFLGLQFAILPCMGHLNALGETPYASLFVFWIFQCTKAQTFGAIRH